MESTPNTDRKDYLVKLAQKHNVKPELVFQAAALMGII